jgi:hypothetical protein
MDPVNTGPTYVVGLGIVPTHFYVTHRRPLVIEARTFFVYADRARTAACFAAAVRHDRYVDALAACQSAGFLARHHPDDTHRLNPDRVAAWAAVWYAPVLRAAVAGAYNVVAGAYLGTAADYQRRLGDPDFPPTPLADARVIGTSVFDYLALRLLG